MDQELRDGQYQNPQKIGTKGNGRSSIGLAWRLEGLHAAVDGDVGRVPLEAELHAVPVAVVEGDARGAHVLGAGAQVEVDVQVAVQQLHRKVVLQENTPLKPSKTAFQSLVSINGYVER